MLLIALIFIAVFIPWTKRVGRKLPFLVTTSRGSIVRALLLRMSWRIFLVCFGWSCLVSDWGATNAPERAGNIFGQLFIISIAVEAAYCWHISKSLLETRSSAAVTANQSLLVGKAIDGGKRAVKPATENASQLSRTVKNSTWWKRMFTVLEITALVVGVTLVSVQVLPKINHAHTPKNNSLFDPADLDLSRGISEAEYQALVAKKTEERTRQLWMWAIIIVAPPVLVRLTRIAVTYVVQGKVS
jgi:hypothetical protein